MGRLNSNAGRDYLWLRCQLLRSGDKAREMGHPDNLRFYLPLRVKWIV